MTCIQHRLRQQRYILVCSQVNTIVDSVSLPTHLRWWLSTASSIVPLSPQLATVIIDSREPGFRICFDRSTVLGIFKGAVGILWKCTPCIHYMDWSQKRTMNSCRYVYALRVYMPHVPPCGSRTHPRRSLIRAEITFVYDEACANLWT